MKKISLKDIAKKAGASPSTVSFVLNGKEKEMRISPELAKKVKKIAQNEGYHPNKLAVGLRTGKSNIIGLIVDTISGHFFASLARIIEREVEGFGYKVIYCSTGNDTEKGKELIRMLYQHRVDGYLITPAEGMEQEIEALVAHGKPVVLIDSYFPGTQAPYVLVNNYDGVAKGVLHLIEKGYRKIAFVYNDVNLIQMQERKKAYAETLRTQRVGLDQRLILKTKYKASKEEVTQAICTFLEATRPQAVFFAANYLGVYGLDCLKTLGLRIPEDIAVVCFDDHELFNLYRPEITAIQQPIEEIAKTAVDILMTEMGASKRKARQRQMEINARLIERSST